MIPPATDTYFLASAGVGAILVGLTFVTIS
jgi:hypothetical protein